jgi:hypothetical protein
MNYNVAANTASATKVAWQQHLPVSPSIPSRSRYMWGAAIPGSPTKLSKKNLALTNAFKTEFIIPPFSPKSKVTMDLGKATISIDYSTSLVDAENLLADIRRARAQQTIHVAQLAKDIQEHLQQAALEQMVGGCHEEAQESIQHANHLKQERELISSAMAVLDFHILSMESIIEDAQLMQASVVDCSEHQFFAQELNAQLRLGAPTRCGN